MLASEITWERFANIHENPTKEFERLCWHLFKHYYAHNESIPHSNPNNPGIEIDPILSRDSKTRISFQSKWFEKMDYSQVRHSAEMAVKHYSGKVDKIYLFSNKDVTVTSAAYTDILNLLKKAGIELEPVTNLTILQMAENHPGIAELYFGTFVPDDNWFKEKLARSIATLDKRYNPRFNVDNTTELLLSLFSGGNKALTYINNKKNLAIEEIATISRYSNIPIKKKAVDIISSLPDVSDETIVNALSWSSILKDELSDDIKQLEDKLLKLRDEFEHFEENNGNQKKETQSSSQFLSREKKNEIYRQILEVERLMAIPELLSLNINEQQALLSKIMLMTGEAGIGKSHSIALIASESMESGTPVLLLLGQQYISDEDIFKQVMTNLGVHADFVTLLDVLDAFGDRLQKKIVIYIDALNESRNKEVWRQGLPKIVNEIQKRNNLKLLVSCRDGYQSTVLSDEIESLIHRGDILHVIHFGFSDNTLEAASDFMNHYGIPFTPVAALEVEASNPLFLSLLCETYSGNYPTIDEVFERLIEKADKETRTALGISLDINLAGRIVKDFCMKILDSGFAHSIPLEDLLAMRFWDTYGLSNSKVEYFHLLKSTGLFMDIPINGEEYVCFSYDRFRELACAKYLLGSCDSKDNAYQVMKDQILCITDGKVCNRNNIELFIACCAEYAKKYHEECISIIDDLSDDGKDWFSEKNEILSRYYKSFDWRDGRDYTWVSFYDVIKKYGAPIEDILSLFVRHSASPNHPLNADRLHSILIRQKLAERDGQWTIFVNGLNSEDRMLQLIEYIQRGKEYQFRSTDESRLLLILLTWTLSSSNRIVRDKASKAMIEILRTNFDHCKYLIGLYQGCDDPYVLQRLYGIILGACIKRNKAYKEEYSLLAKEVYQLIFNRDDVYPDILLRDYARMIIERWLFEYPGSEHEIDVNKITPPYPAIEFPQIAPPVEASYDSEPGLHLIQMSMTPDKANVGIGMYGDFGRYVFQSRVEDFIGADIEQCYNYAIDFIKNKLGYEEKTLGFYDTHERRSASRSENKKLERIGKKYEWIAYFNILARLSDKYSIESYEYGQSASYEGPWNPMIRDFDPTLNVHFFGSTNDPIFDKAEMCSGFIDSTDMTIEELSQWAEIEPECIQKHGNALKVKDNHGTPWIYLMHRADYENEIYHSQYKTGFSEGGQRLWIDSYACVVEKKNAEFFIQTLQQANFWGRWMTDFPKEYPLFNMEYAWSNGYKSIFDHPWYVLELPSESGLDLDVAASLEKYAPLTSGYIWEGEYDGSIDDAISICMPSGLLIEGLNLHQKEYNGHFYNNNNELIIIDGRTGGCAEGLLIREDALNEFLNTNDYVLFWTTLANKLYKTASSRNEYVQSDWSGLYYYENGEIKGAMRCVGVYPRDVR